jgi:TolB-like protein/Tfp pilus assembly protein PilF
MIQLLTELRRRNVVRIALLYIASGWALLQVSKFLLDLFAAPAWIIRLMLAVLVLLFPAVLVFAWRYELTPEGLRPTTGGADGTGARRRIGRRINLAIIALFSIVVAGLIVNRTTPIGTDLIPAADETVAAPPPVQVTADPRPSIAVLPFKNRSDRPEDQYFTDGMHDDILTRLAKIGALKVIARTSVEQFRETTLTTSAIGRQLAVRTVLEGGVQRAGDRVRINVQLIDAADDGHIWAETYDRTLTAVNVFAIQTEIAAAVAHALEAALTPAEKRRIEATPTRSLEAWEAYQLGQQRLARRTSESLAQAVTFFERAIVADRSFAQAHAALAETLRLQVGYSGAARAETLEHAESVVARALALKPDLAEAITVEARLAQDRDELEVAERGYLRALRLDPNYAPAHQHYSRLLASQSRRAEALSYAERAVALDPLSAIVNVNLADTLAGDGRYTEAIARYRKAIEIDPALPAAYRNLGFVEAYALGRIDQAVPLFERSVASDPESPEWAVWLAALYLDLGDDGQARRWTTRSLELAPEHVSVQLIAAFMELLTGHREAALEHTRRTLEIDPAFAGALMLLRNEDLRRGDAAAARARYAQAYPGLLGEGAPTIDGANADAAIDLATVLMLTGEEARANQLLDGVEKFIAPLPRMNVDGYGVADVQLHAIRGDDTRALAALREAVDAGWRADWRYYRDHEPAFGRIRGTEEFDRIFGEIEADLARQRARLAASSARREAPARPSARS